MIAYADTGFLVSLYGRDSNSALARSSVVETPIFLLTPLGESEFTNATELLVFRKEWTRAEARSVHETFAQHQRSGLFRPAQLGPDVWERALALSRRHSSTLGTRTLDILHVAAALAFKPDVFCSFDRRQRKLAVAERLFVLPS